MYRVHRTSRRYDPAWAGNEYRVTKLLGHRKSSKKGIEYLVRWWGCDENKKQWDDTWEPEENVGDGNIEEYEAKLNLVESKKISVDVKPALQAVRKTIAQTLAIDKTRLEPLQHDIALDMLALEPLAMSILEMVAALGAAKGGKPLEIATTISQDNKVVKTVTYNEMWQVDKFCAFQHFLDAEKAIGAIRYNVGQASNKEISCVSIPMRFSVTYNRSIPGLVTTEVHFPTMRFNGAYGTPTPPQTLSDTHKLKNENYMDTVVAYVKDTLPSSHPLVGKGWTQLPRLEWELADADAVPA